MSATFINNKGVIQTRFQKNNSPEQVSEMKWNANYDGDKAIVKLDTVSEGKKKNYRIKLNNDELAKLLSIPPVNVPLEDRLTSDFLSPRISPRVIDPFSGIQLDKQTLSNFDIKPVLKMVPKEQPYSVKETFSLTPSNQMIPFSIQNSRGQGLKTKKRRRRRKKYSLGLGLGFKLGLRPKRRTKKRK